MTEASCRVRFGASCQAVDAGHDDILDGVGDDDLLERPGQHIAVLGPSQSAHLLEGLDHLLDEEGIALGLADDQGLQRVGEGCSGEQRLRHLDAVRCGEGIKGDPRVVGALAEGLDVARTVGEDAEDAAGGDAVSREEQVCLRRLVHPVDVLKDRDLRTHLGGTSSKAAQGVEDLAPALLRVHAQHRRIARIDGEEVAQVREGRPEILAQAEDPSLDLRHDRRFGVTLLDAKIPPAACRSRGGTPWSARRTLSALRARSPRRRAAGGTPGGGGTCRFPPRR